MTLVVDADVAFKWHVEQQDSVHAEPVLKWHGGLHAPDFQYLEVRQVLAKYVRQRLITQAAALEATQVHGGMINVWHSHAILAGPAFDLALRFGHPFYDCLYLALALRLDGRVVTADKKFAGRFAIGDHAGRVVLLADFAAVA
jgi:predicted nucleic acid-binding protein